MYDGHAGYNANFVLLPVCMLVVEHYPSPATLNDLQEELLIEMIL